MTEMHLSCTLESVKTWHILRLPPEASRELPSRGMLMAAGTLNGIPVTAPWSRTVWGVIGSGFPMR